ncbi:hypothetical protein B484DRAFT_395004 [Ochromonadaceae sp. CCMP2298]|nr:hypothetical protein B484DRAFT_395004 [Ochromonadaceae sp. CCMP2298]
MYHISTKDSIFEHSDCTSVAPELVDQCELLANVPFVTAATGLTSHNAIARLVRDHCHGASISQSMSSKVSQTLRDQRDLEGFEEGFAQVRYVLENFKQLNNGTVYEIEQEDDRSFKHLVFVPGQSFNIVANSARTYYCLDAGFSKN